MSKEKNDGETRYCKKCGCELPTTSKYKLCDDCRRKRAGKIRKWGEGGLGVCAFVVAVLKALGGNHNDDSSARTNEENNDDDMEA